MWLFEMIGPLGQTERGNEHKCGGENGINGMENKAIFAQ